MQTMQDRSGRRNMGSATSASGALASAVIYAFDNFQLNSGHRRLTAGGVEIDLPRRVFHLLYLLVQRPGELLTKEELLGAIWADAFVEEANLNVAISMLRRTLNDDPHNRRYIQTVPGRGYRFIADVRKWQEQPAATAIASAPQDYPEPEVQTPSTQPPMDPSIAGQTNLSYSRSLSDHTSAPQASMSEIHPAHRPRGAVRGWSFTLIAAGLVAAVSLGGWRLFGAGEPIRTLAVLPLTVDNASGNKWRGGSPDEFLLLGITDALISRLSGELVVRPTSSVLKYSQAGMVNPVSAGRDQEADAVLTGVLDGDPGRTNLKLRLIRVRDGVTLWQDTFHGASNDLFALQQSAGDVAARELTSLGATWKPSRGVARSGPSADSATLHVNESAYQLYLRGRYFWNWRTVEGLRKSADYFRKAIAADPNYAPAYAGLADSYALMASFSVEPGSAANADARSAAFSAIHLSPTLAEPHASLGMIYFYIDWNLTAAEREFEVSIRLNPNYAMAHHWYALDLAAMGRFPQALYEIRLAQKLDPLSLVIGTNLGWIEYLARDYSAAQRDLYRVLELDPDFMRARTRLGMVEIGTGDYRSAVANLTRALALSGDKDPRVEGLLGDAEALAGNSDAAQRTLADLHKRGKTQYVPPTSYALVLMAMGRKPEALAALAEAVDDRSTSMVYARVDPSFDPLRSDRRFQQLLSGIKP
jgi:DNA-binding winged helix-turn-helix (wHTH) protein/Tfp pilus assembly protein PilF/TolB-like protein